MRRCLALGFAAAWIVVSCSSSSTEDDGPRLPIGWVKGAAEAANGPAPEVDVTDACGSPDKSYLGELVDTAPFAAKVQKHWGDCVEGGKQIAAAGTVAHTHLGPIDLPFDHPFGDDLTMDITADAPFVPFSQLLGKGGADPDASNQPGQFHVEISCGFIPHTPRPPNPPTGQTWRQLSDFNLDRGSFQPGFAEPPAGDRTIVMGRWIVDCGHDDFHTELHALSFVGFAHVDGAKTTARFYYNPYRDTELYALAPDKLGAVNDAARLNDGLTFPKHLVREVLGVDNGSLDRLAAYEMVEATKVAPPDFRVCAPAGASGSLVVQADVVTRPDVTLTISPNDSTGCATVHVAFDRYVPADANVRRCTMPWTYLQDTLEAGTGVKIDLESKVLDNIKTPEGKQRAQQDPECACGDALAGPPVTEQPTTPADKGVRVDPTTPIPFYGVITAERR